MHITAHNVYDLHSPVRCERRCYYKLHRHEEVSPGAFEELLFKLGSLHEERYIETIRPFVDVGAVPFDERASLTRHLLQQKESVIYHGYFCTEITVGTHLTRLSGAPDILVREGSSYVVRECKLARTADEKNHVEILLQLQIYGYLLQQATGSPPSRLEVYLGDGSVEAFVYDGGISALAAIEEIVGIASLAKAPYSPPGWSKCQGCVFTRWCWELALKRKEAAIVPGVDQGLARILRNQGVVTADELLSHYTEDTLARLRRPWGARTQKVGTRKARSALLHARALVDNRHIFIRRPSLPQGPNLVMFDLEGIPAYMDELQKIYLWGTKVCGVSPSPFIPALAPVGPDGDELGWEQFLANCEGLFSRYGDISFVHWASYEKTNVKLYIDRYGDRDGIAARVLANLEDLLPVAKASVAIPEPSYSLKCVERQAGFRRTQSEYGGTWAMAKYIEAVETSNDTLREDIIQQILTYNEEDLEATWAVYQWLRALTG